MENILDMSGYVFENDDNTISLELFEGDGPELNPNLYTDIIFPTNVKQILEEGFADFVNLQRILIPESVEIIEDYAFCNCFEVTFIKFVGTSRIKYIGSEAFLNAGVHSGIAIPFIYIPNSCLEIGNKAFENVNTSICSVPRLENIIYESDDEENDEFLPFTSPTNRLYIFVRELIRSTRKKNIMKTKLKHILLYNNLEYHNFSELRPTFFYKYRDIRNEITTAVLKYDNQRLQNINDGDDINALHLIASNNVGLYNFVNLNFFLR